MSDETAGIVVVDKPPGLTSHDVVGRVRRLAGTRRVGHAGTLDPMATGVLVLGVGRATRLLGHLALRDKAYTATMRLGVSTSTDDAQGEVLARSDVSHLGDQTVREVAARFVGELDQVPSAVSAVKVAGHRAYALARRGENVQLAPRRVRVAELTVHEVRRVDDCLDVDLAVVCSTGTYVRALARDIGAALGVGAHLTALRRTRVGPFGLAEAVTLDELAGAFRFVGLDEVARRCFPGFAADEDQVRQVSHGRPLVDADLGGDGPVAVFGPDGRFLALYACREGQARPVAVFTG